jgi:hypothetical protein
LGDPVPLGQLREEITAQALHLTSVFDAAAHGFAALVKK